MGFRWIACACLGLICLQGTVLGQEESFEEFLKREKKEFERFKAESDREFAEFLRKTWEEMEVMRGAGAFRKPKPVAIQPRKSPAESAGRAPDTGPPVAIPRTRAGTTPSASVSPPEIKTPERAAAIPVFTVDFFGTAVDFPEAIRLSLPSGRPLNEEGLAQAWEQMSGADFAPMLERLQEHRKHLQLNDWGYCRLVYAVGRSLGQGSPRSGVLFTWFMLNKSGLDARVGYTDDDLFLMLASEQTLFGTSFLTMKPTGRRYYLVGLEPSAVLPQKSLHTYNGDSPGESRLLTFRLAGPPALNADVETRTLRFVYRGMEHTIPVTLRRDAVRFFEYYPQTEFGVYFASPVSTQAASSLMAALRPLVEGKSEREAVNLILHFVQGAFEYKTDQEAFGREKPMFPDETLFYPASDCEDRAILFAHLVTSLTGLEVVGLDFPGHIATAVRFRGEVKGTGITYKGKRYIVCDPTYMNADVGEAMPTVKLGEAKVIVW